MMNSYIGSVRRTWSPWSSGRGTTLVEVLIATVVFATLALGISLSMVLQRKDSENALNQTLAQATAGGILEQIRCAGFSALSDFTAAATSATVPVDYPPVGGETALDAAGVAYLTYRCMPTIFIGVTADNHAEVPAPAKEFHLYWANGPGVLYAVGTRTDPNDLTSTILGVVVDVDYKDSTGNVVRPRRYMKMEVGITRVLNANKDAVEVTLRYRWAKPGVLNSGLPDYYPVRSLRTVVSKINTY